MQLSDLHVVLKVAEFRSITAAANSLDMRTATASAALKRVEQALGSELFVRTTRQLRLSSAGERFLPQCEQALTLLAQAQQNLQQDAERIEGELRIAAASDLGRNVIAPWLDEVMAEHTGLSLKLHLSDSKADFYRDPINLALRYGSPTDASLYGFKICSVPRLLVASPEYLARASTPQSLEDLPHHNGLLYQLYDITYDTWTFQRDGQDIKVKMPSDRAANDGDLVRRWCVAGKGLAVKSCLDLADDLLAGRLQPLLTNSQPKGTELWLICPSRPSITPAVRLLRESLTGHCKARLDSLVKAGLLDADRLGD
ncbi:LysR family transcriptional regulator [Ferrimonas marina]|uniref:DNA-binding transcriptional regulator, LysR family n=1 Tax=Ferrimonas marina TaxID=299255 RepID=A0A1M5MKH5_9GAMM|nr:LysR family transcriptional regulator [Ferrimonas marina]SHG77954.1 DNA-binding transcriptional regulator, LysR family [Ferrimonas marina]